MERKIIREHLQEIDSFQFQGTFEYIVKFLNDIKARYPLHFDFAVNVDQWYSGDEIRVYASREETEREYQIRLKRAEKSKEAAAKRKVTLAAKNAAKKVEVEAKEFAEYQRLQKKYG